MSSGTKVPFSKVLLRSLFVPIFLVGWVIGAMNAEARVQQRVDIANDGTVYQYICSDGLPAGTNHDRFTNVSMAIAFNGAATVVTTVQSGTTLTAKVPATPLVTNFARAKRSINLALDDCPPTIVFNAAGGGTWTSGASSFSGFNAAGLTQIDLIAPFANITNTADCDGAGDVYGFGGTATCVKTVNTAEPGDGGSLVDNSGVLFVYNGASFIPANTAGTLNVAGGAAGFDVDGAGLVSDATGDSDTISLQVTTTTSTSTSTSSSTSSSTSTSTSTTTSTSTSTTTTTIVIPTVGHWGMAILALAFLGAIGWMLRARRSLRQ